MNFFSWIGSLYKRKYAPHYRHPKKLFAFDIFLIFLIIAFATISLVWFFYTPKYAGDVNVEIHITNGIGDGRFLSGEPILIDLVVKNNANFPLIQPEITIFSPEGLIIESLSGDSLITQNLTDVSLHDIGPQTHVKLNTTGSYLQSPRMVSKLIAKISYKTPNEPWLHTAIGSYAIQTPDTLWEFEVGPHAPLIYPGTVAIPISVKPKRLPGANAGIRLGIIGGSTATGFSFSSTTLLSSKWNLSSEGTDFIVYATPDETSDTMSMQLQASVVPLQENASFEQINELFTFEVLRPEVHIQLSPDKTKVVPGEKISFTATIENTSNFAFEQVSLDVPIAQDVFDINRIDFPTAQGTMHIQIPEPPTLAPGQSLTTTFSLPVRYVPNGNIDIKKQISLIFSGEIDATGQRFQSTAFSPEIIVGSTLAHNTRLVYYTDSGDQIGRGPFPYQAGKTTKFWIVSKVANTTSNLENAQVRFALAPGVTATGNTSISNGQDVSIHGNTVEWNKQQLQPFEGVTIAFEVEITPLTQALMPIVESISLSGFDTYIQKDINKSFGVLGTNASHFDDSSAKKLQ
ncbi:hypothetical protein H6758_04180 [Candidatus Nomurabacteria bacterium]|nr:hypothetical protein [Candidatus Nomurabacteria bacterium]